MSDELKGYVVESDSNVTVSVINHRRSQCSKPEGCDSCGEVTEIFLNQQPIEDSAEKKEEGQR